MITKPMPDTEPDPFGLSAAGHLCFVCGKGVEDPTVVWSGNDGYGQQIYLHGECDIKLALGLMRDGLELRYAGRFCWNQLDRQRA